jgi:hypothetical protein
MDPIYPRQLLTHNAMLWIDIPMSPSMEDPVMLNFEQRIRNGTWELSDQRAKICAMNQDTVTAGLWALSGFDPALVHLAELRERFAKLPEDDRIRITLDRLTSVYVEGQCHELERAAEITTEAMHELFTTGLGNVIAVTNQILRCTNDPLAIEIGGYAMRLGVLTAHGAAPWKRFAAVIADCHSQLQVT